MKKEILICIGRNAARFGVGALLGNIGATSVIKNFVSLSDKKLANKVMTGVGAAIITGMITDMAADYVENDIESYFDQVEALKELKNTLIAKKGDTDGQQISEQQQVSGAAEGGEPGGETSGEKEA